MKMQKKKLVSSIKITNDEPIPVKAVPLAGRISERGDAPRCSTEQVKHFVENWEKILPPRVIRSIKRHNDVLHGARSVNMIVGKKYSRPTKDFDVYSKEPRKRAHQIENEIDRCMGCDMAYVHYQAIPKLDPMGTDDELTAKELFIVKTVPHQDGDVDYMMLPRGLPTHTRKGIRHEDLREAYRKAKKNVYHPLRYFKASDDIRRIEAYWRSRGKKV